MKKLIRTRLQSSLIGKSKHGLGLGLNISNRLAHQLGGEGIQLKSTIRVGSSFSFNIQEEIQLSIESHEVQVEDREEISEDVCVNYKKMICHTASRKLLILHSEYLLAKKSSCDCPEILIVDDNEFNIYTLKALLEIMGVKK